MGLTKLSMLLAVTLTLALPLGARPNARTIDFEEGVRSNNPDEVQPRRETGVRGLSWGRFRSRGRLFTSGRRGWWWLEDGALPVDRWFFDGLRGDGRAYAASR